MSDLVALTDKRLRRERRLDEADFTHEARKRLARLKSSTVFSTSPDSGVMIDWITGQITATRDGEFKGAPRLFDTGRFQQVTNAGEIAKSFASRVPYIGSHDSALSFRAPYFNQLEMSGNPAKFLQGHNLFGVSDPLSLFFAAGLSTGNLFGPGTSDEFNRFPDPHTWEEFEFERPRFTRLDLTRSYRFSSSEEARAWIKHVAANGRSRHQISNGLDQGKTVYFGKSSTRWTFKIYYKFDEITAGGKGHGLSPALSISEYEALTDWARGVVRFELTLRSPEIKKLPYNFDPLKVWEAYFEKIQFNQNMEVTAMDDLRDIPRHLRMALVAWRSGEDLRLMYSKNQFSRNRRALLAYGVDIAMPPATENTKQLASLLFQESWDPRPIEELLHRPDSEITRNYGL